MKASRPSKVIINAAPPEEHGWMGVLRRQSNNILTGLLVIAAIAMLIKWRMRTAEAAKMTVNAQLVSAQSQVDQVHDLSSSTAAGEDLLKRLNFLQNSANSSISNVLNSSDADARMRAGAFVARGDLYWYLANLPPLPGSATQPSLQLSESSTTLLQKCSDAYQEVLKNSTYADQHDAIAQAHMGMAAIAENNHDWDAARREFDAVVNASGVQQVLKTAAQTQIDVSADLQKTAYYVAPAEGTPDASMQSKLDAIMAAMGATTAPSTAPSTMPSTKPATTRPATKPTTRVARNDPLRDEVENFWHYAKIARYDVATAEGKKIVARRGDPEQLRSVLEETAILHQDQMDRCLSRWQKVGELEVVTSQLISAMNIPSKQ